MPERPATTDQSGTSPTGGPGGASGGAPLTAALDIGGTKIAAALVTAGGEVVARARRPTPATPHAAEVQAAVTACLRELAGHPGWRRVTALGVCSAGPVDRARGTASPVNIPAWRDHPLLRNLGEVPGLPELAGLRTVFAGDAVAMTAAEHRYGAARGHADALCMVVSTGVGAGLVLDGRVRPGPTGNAGHLGHVSVDLAGEPCPCGSRGCLERLASGGAITRHALALGWRPAPGAESGTASVAAAAREGDTAALAAFDRAARALAAGIAGCSTLLELEVAVLGGGVMHASDLLLPAVKQHLDEYAALPFARIQIKAAALGTDAGLIGAAALAQTAGTAGTAETPETV
ncbi:ROK family protein [Streptomyces sp. HPF1205]|uniref:ROK family protein n=1 Tax=Streptomyces sp. HPF1205 TaxID=2873262 RepID=UPI001CEDC456|nr:ROK family protein [Streptomyces sp. HPF1205]